MYLNNSSIENKLINNRFKQISRSLLFWGIVIYRIILDFSFPSVICAYYYHYGFYFQPNFTKYVLSYVSMLLLAVMFIPKIKTGRPSSIILLTLMLLAYIPNMSLFAGMDLPYEYFFMSNLYWFAMAFFYKLSYSKEQKISLKENIPKLAIGRTKWPEHVKKYGIFYLAFILIFIYSVLYNRGLSFTVDLSDAYELRMASRGNINKLFSFLLPWCCNIIFPIGVIVSIKNKNPLIFALMIIGFISGYSVNGVKSWLFIGVLSISSALVIKRDNQVGYLPLFLAVIAFSGTVTDIQSYTGFFINNFIVRRVFFGTSLNNHYWIEFFTDHPKTYFTSGILGWLRNFIDVPYDVNVSSIIGGLYYGNYESNASSGTIAAAYSNLDWPGLIIFPLFIVFVVKLLDSVVNKPEREISVIYTYPLIMSSCIYLLNGDIFTAFITYGFLFGIIILNYLSYTGVFK